MLLHISQSHTPATMIPDMMTLKPVAFLRAICPYTFNITEGHRKDLYIITANARMWLRVHAHSEHFVNVISFPTFPVNLADCKRPFYIHIISLFLI